MKDVRESDMEMRPNSDILDIRNGTEGKYEDPTNKAAKHIALTWHRYIWLLLSDLIIKNIKNFILFVNAGFDKYNYLSDIFV